MKGTFSGYADENEKWKIFVLCVFHSFVCLRESFQMAKEDKFQIYFF